MTLFEHPILKTLGPASKFERRYLFTACEGSRAIVLQGNSLRWCLTTDSEYQFMDVEPLVNGTEEAIINDNGDLLCIYNEHEIHVLPIPWTGPNDVDKGRRKYSIEGSEVVIKQVLFHPLGFMGATIVVLFSNDTLSIIDMQTSNDNGSIFQNILNKEKQLGATYLGRVTDIERICFGIDKMTLYALSCSEGGDIYAFYPCLPPHLHLSTLAVDDIMNRSIVLYNQLDADTSVAAKKNIIKQLKFASMLMDNKDEIFQVPSNYLNVRAQGPFTISSFPERLYGETAIELVSLPIDDQNELLLMGYDDGTILVLFKDLEITMSWDSNGYYYNNSLILLETINVKNNSNQYRIGINKCLPGQFTVLNLPHESYKYDTRKWSEPFAESIKELDLGCIAGLQIKSNSRIITETNIRSWAKWQEIGRLYEVWFSNIGYMASKIKVETRQASENKAMSESLASVAQPKFTVPLEEIQSLNDHLQKLSHQPFTDPIPAVIRQAQLGNPDNEEQLLALTDISKELLQRIMYAQSLDITLYNRIVEMQDELERQLLQSKQVLERNKALEMKTTSLDTKMKVRLSRQDKLTERFANLQKKMVQVTKSPRYQTAALSDKELDFYRELKRQVLLFNDYVHKHKTLSETIAFLKKELQQIALSKASADGPLEEWQELKSLLETDSKIINDCKTQLQAASDMLMSR